MIEFVCNDVIYNNLLIKTIFCIIFLNLFLFVGPATILNKDKIVFLFLFFWVMNERGSERENVGGAGAK